MLYFGHFFLLSLQPLMAKDMSQLEAIKIIQVAERARQGRQRAKMNEENRKANRMYRTKDPETANIESAAVCIQKVLMLTLSYMYLSFPWVMSSFMLKDLVECDLQVWRGYIQRKRTKIAREEEMIFLGMVRKMGHDFL